MVFETDHFSIYVIVEEGHEHNYQSAVTAPTCTEDGFTTYTYGCGDSYEADPVDSLGHSWDAGEVTTTATCLVSGVKTFTCGSCEETENRPLGKNPDNHTGESHVAGKKDATCDADGYTGDTVCECGKIIESGEAIPATKKHLFTKYTSDGNATCKKNGTKTAKCDYGCGKTDTVTDKGSKLGHKYQGDTCVRCGATKWNPDTGDKIMIAVTVLIISGSALFALLFRKKRK